MFKKKLPTKRVVIAGCRDYNNYDEAKSMIEFARKCNRPVRIKKIHCKEKIISSDG